MNKKVGGIIGRIYPNNRISYVKKFKKGLINESYEVKINNKALVLRIYPRDFWKVKKEKYLYNLIRKKTDVPVPKIIKTGRNYLLMSKIKGKELQIKDRALIKKAGELLAKIHSIKFHYYGWIISNEIKPKFKNWLDFINYDTNLKFRKIPKKYIKLKNKIKNIIEKNKSLLNILNIKSKPCLLHKDYHSSHIIVAKHKIEGIIDLEWAMSGHNEFDIVKSLLWIFDKKPELEKIFLEGYKKYGRISREFNKRRGLYKILHSLSSLSFSYECKNKKWCIYNLKKLKGAINEYNKNK